MMLLDFTLVVLFFSVWIGACWYMMEQVFIDEEVRRKGGR
jgi:hypothetical protein